MSYTQRGGAQIQLAQQIGASLRLEGERFSYRLNPRMVRLAESAMEVPLGPEPPLPAQWTFSRYSVGEFQRWARVLRALCGIHVLARVRASAGLREWGFADSLVIMDRREIHRRMVRYTGLDEETTGALLEDHTYGSRGIQQPDLALQPLIPVLPDKLGIAPNLVLCSRLERNFAVLMNRIPEERAIYNSLSSDREARSRGRIVDTLTPMRMRHWHGNVPGWDVASEVDLALMDEESKHCLILELKSFVAPAEVREIWGNRSVPWLDGAREAGRRDVSEGPLRAAARVLAAGARPPGRPSGDSRGRGVVAGAGYRAR